MNKRIAILLLLAVAACGGSAESAPPAVPECIMYIPYGIEPTAPIPFEIVDGLLVDGGSLPSGWTSYHSDSEQGCQCGVSAPDGKSFAGVCQ